MTKIIKPTDPGYTVPKRKGYLCIGRIVHYFPYEEAHPRAAIVVHVHDSDEYGEVNLTVFELDGVPANKVRVKYADEPKARHWCWPHDSK